MSQPIFRPAQSLFLQPIDAYEQGPLGQVRAYLKNPEALKAAAVSDLRKIGGAIVRLGQMPNPPRRVTLCSDAYQAVHQALTQRLREIEAHRDLALSTDLEK